MTDDNSLFKLDQNGGTLKTAEVFDFEAGSLHHTIQARDENGAKVEKSFVINVLNEDEESDNHPPADLNTTAQITVKENGQVRVIDWFVHCS